MYLCSIALKVCSWVYDTNPLEEFEMARFRFKVVAARAQTDLPWKRDMFWNLAHMLTLQTRKCHRSDEKVAVIRVIES